MMQSTSGQSTANASAARIVDRSASGSGGSAGPNRSIIWR
jgi:hypothetical protein